MIDRIKKLPHSQCKEAIIKLYDRSIGNPMLEKIVCVAVEELEKKESEWYE